jgi:hypothetical protein
VVLVVDVVEVVVIDFVVVEEIFELEVVLAPAFLKTLKYGFMSLL